jgi:type I site-specific restriction endonuclease
MQALIFPPFDAKLRHQSEVEIYDTWRRKWVVCTPEEWVRQHLAHWLVNDLEVPLGRIAIEKSLKYEGAIKRCDLVVYDAFGKPELIAECKASTVALSDSTYFQATRYNQVLKVPLLIITNGLHLFGAIIHHDSEQWEALQHLPNYHQWKKLSHRP